MKATKEIKKNSQEVAKIDFSLATRWIQFAQVSAASVKAYSKGIKRLQEYFVSNQIEKPTRADLIAYREFLGKKYQPTTANLYLTSCKLFFEFLAVEKYIGVNPAEHIKGFKISSAHKKSALSIDQTKAVLSRFDAATMQGLRNKALYALMTTCGLRCVEVARANISDIEIIGNVYRLRVQGKGHTQKIQR